MKQQLYMQIRKSQQLSRISKSDCWIDGELESNGNGVHFHPNKREMLYELHIHSSMQCVRCSVLDFGIVSLHRREDYLEEIIILQNY